MTLKLILGFWHNSREFLIGHQPNELHGPFHVVLSNQGGLGSAAFGQVVQVDDPDVLTSAPSVEVLKSRVALLFPAGPEQLFNWDRGLEALAGRKRPVGPWGEVADALFYPDHDKWSAFCNGFTLGRRLAGDSARPVQVVPIDDRRCFLFFIGSVVQAAHRLKDLPDSPLHVIMIGTVEEVRARLEALPNA